MQTPGLLPEIINGFSEKHTELFRLKRTKTTHVYYEFELSTHTQRASSAVISLFIDRHPPEEVFGHTSLAAFTRKFWGPE